MIIDLLIFIGMGLYLLSSLGYLYLFLRTLRTTDGIGLQFLRYLTLSLSIGPFVIFVVRFLGMYDNLDPDLSRAIAIINPILLLATVLYLNYLFHGHISLVEKKKIIETNKDVKIIKSDVKEIKKNVV